MINTCYRAYEKINILVIELLRQFYDEDRTFRIIGNNGKTDYVVFSNSDIKPQSLGIVDNEELFRMPIFDIDVKAQKQNPYSTLSQNETAMNLYNAGFFDPQNAQMAMAALKLMTFEGKKEIEDYITQGQTLQNQMMQIQNQLQAVMQENAILKGIAVQETGEAL